MYLILGGCNYCFENNSEYFPQIFNKFFSIPPTLHNAHSMSRRVYTLYTVNRGYSAQCGYSAQSAFPLLGLHILIVSQTWAPKSFQHLFMQGVAYCWKSFKHFKQWYDNYLQFGIKLVNLWPYGIDHSFWTIGQTTKLKVVLDSWRP